MLIFYMFFLLAPVLFGSLFILPALAFIFINGVKKGAAAEGMKLHGYVCHGHDPASVAVMTEVIAVQNN